MIRSLNYRWRQLATGISFASFGIGGLLVPLLASPGLLLFRSPLRRERYTKGLLHGIFRLFVWEMRTLGVLSYEIKDIEKFREPGRLIIANHPTLIDVVFLISLIPRADCIVKSRLLHNPFTRGPIRAAGYIANDNPDEVVEAARASLARGNSVIIFPEGTRSVPGQALKLQRGAANISLRSGNKISPVVIKCTPLTLTKHEKWYEVPPRRAHFSLQMNPEIDISTYENITPSVAARQFTAYLQDYFTKELAHSGGAGT